MRLGFDLDGTVADLHSALALEARRLFPDIDPAAIPNSAAPGTGPASSDAPPNAGSSQPEEQTLSFGSLSARQQREIWNAVCDRENFWETLDEIEPGALARSVRAGAGTSLGTDLPHQPTGNARRHGAGAEPSVAFEHTGSSNRRSSSCTDRAARLRPRWRST